MTISELTEGLVSLLWPHYMRTIPSLSIVEFLSRLARAQAVGILTGIFFRFIRPVGPQKTACRTTCKITLQPISLTEAHFHTEPDGRSAIRLRFACSQKSGLDEIRHR